MIQLIIERLDSIEKKIDVKMSDVDRWLNGKTI